MNDPFTGAGYLLRGFYLISQRGLRRYAMVPILVSLLLLALLLWLAFNYFDQWLALLLPPLPAWLDWLQGVIWLLSLLLLLLLCLFSFTLLTNLIAAPFNALLAEAVERHLIGAGKPPAGSLAQVLRDIPQLLLDELSRLFYILRWGILLLLLFLIPGLNLIAPLLWTLFSAWMVALEYGGHVMGNHGLRPAVQRQQLRTYRWLALGFGGITMMALLTPLLNLLVMPAAVAGSTALWVDRLRTTALNHPDAIQQRLFDR